MSKSASILLTFATAMALATCGGSGSTDPGGGGNGGGGGGGDGGGSSEPAAVSVVSGGSQSAKTQAALPNPFVVEVTDADGGPVSGVTVNWAVTAGPGAVSPSSSTTDAQGRASSTFSGGTTLGSSTVTATVSGVAAAAEFTVETSTLVIRMQGTAFVGPDGSDAVTIPLGATVEWENFDAVQHTATSTDVPAGGAAFDSGTMGNGETFTFTPSVGGTWTYFCEVHPTLMAGATITVTGGGGGGGEATAVDAVSGDGQSAKTLKSLSEPFVVEVTDAGGAPVSGVTVNWSVTSGPGSVSPGSSSTNAEGRASSTFTGGTTLGSSTIEATVSGVTGAAEFSVETSTMVIRMQGTAFVAPDGSDAVTIPLGATIEWENLDMIEHTATATDVPAGGASFDTGLVSYLGTASFTPAVEGTWTYRCEQHPVQMAGATITVTGSG